MINMEYCRFQNTFDALRECAETLSLSYLDGLDPIAELSDEEQMAARKLFKLCSDLAEDYSWLIDEPNGEDDA